LQTASPAPTVTPERFEIIPTISQFTVQAFASGLLSAFGHSPTFAIRDFSGEVMFSPEEIDKSRIKITIKADSLTVTDAMKDKDRREIELTMNNEVLESARYPEIVFESTRVSGSKTGDSHFSVQMTGHLTLHGVSHELTIPVQASLTGGTLHTHGEFTVLQTAYGIKPVRVAGGSLKIKDELKLTFNIVARRE